ncbi:MAG: hypothetical protein AB2807_06540, partial [Candidatus Sedimenticola endophacoides]
RGSNGCRVGESILGTGMSQNLSRGSDTLACSHDLPGERFLDQADSLKVGDWINLLGKDGVTRRAKLS